MPSNMGRRRVFESGFVTGEGHLGHRLVSHHGDVGFVKNGEGLLRFAERITEKDGLLAVVEGGLHELKDAIDDFFAGRKEVVRETEGGLHDEDVGLPKLRCFRW